MQVLVSVYSMREDCDTHLGAVNSVFNNILVGGNLTHFRSL